MNKVNEYYKLYPIYSPAYNVARIAGKEIRKRVEKFCSGRLLEIGCGAKNKNLLIGNLVDEHIGLDHESCPHGLNKVDILGSAYEIPADSNIFDCVLSTAVFEHLEFPEKAAKEACRVLKHNGHGIFTTPFFWHLHEEPRDFFRYTKYGLEHIFQEAGFEIVEITPLSGFWITFGSEFNYYLQRFNRGIIKPLVLSWTIFSNILWKLMDRGLLRDDRFSWMYLAVVKKN